MAHLRCFVIVDGGYCGASLERTAERKDWLSATPESPTHGLDPNLVSHREIIRPKLIASQLLMQQLRDSLACAQYLAHERHLIQRQLREVVQNSRTILRTTQDVIAQTLTAVQASTFSSTDWIPSSPHDVAVLSSRVT